MSGSDNQAVVHLLRAAEQPVCRTFNEVIEKLAPLPDGNVAAFAEEFVCAVGTSALLNADLEANWQGATPDHVVKYIAAAALLVGHLALFVSVRSADLCRIVSSVPAEDQEGLVKRLSATWRHKFTSCSGTDMQIRGLSFDNLAAHDVMFADALRAMPPPPADIAMNPDEWPQLDVLPSGAPVAADDVMHRMFWPFTNPKAMSFMRILPSGGQILALSCAQWLAGPGASFLVSAYVAATGEPGATALNRCDSIRNKYPPDTDGAESNLLRHMRRWMLLLELAVAACISIEDTFRVARLDSSLPQVEPTPAIWVDDSYSAMSNAAQFHVMRVLSGISAPDRHSPVLTSWVWDLPGAALMPEALLLAAPLPAPPLPAVSLPAAPVPPAVAPAPPVPQARGDAIRPDTGLTFLMNMLKLPQSAYRMPLKTASQRTWEDWFTRILSVQQDMFPSLPSKMIISAIMGSISTTDKRVYGWFEKTQAATSNGTELDLHAFLQHVRSQVLATNVTRKQAAKELRSLVSDVSGIDDCSHLATKLQQLVAQLYPPVSEEPEPLTRLATCKLIHALLANISKCKGTPALIQAWKGFSEFKPSEMFDKFVEESLHKGGENSKVLLEAYLVEVTRQLERAHRMHVQLHDVRAEPKMHSAAALLGVSQNALALALKQVKNAGATSNKRPRVAASAHAPAPSQATQFAAPSTSPSGCDDPTVLALSPLIRSGLKHVNRTHPNIKLGTIRGLMKGLDAIPVDEAYALCDQGRCLLCQQDGHWYHKCPARDSSQSQGCRDAAELFTDTLDAFLRTRRSGGARGGGFNSQRGGGRGGRHDGSGGRGGRSQSGSGRGQGRGFSAQ